MPFEIPNYTLLNQLGEGAMAEVWLARHRHNDRLAAIKVLKPTMLAHPDAEELFLREGRVLAGFRHPNIVAIYDNTKSGDLAYLVMEYLAGGDLLKRMQRPIQVAEAIGFVVQIAGALEVAHQQQIVHRDLKPANIMLRDETTPVLTDFGTARLLDRSTIYGKDGSIVGTPAYMSPEQITGKPLTGRSDLYALGVLFHELLTGRLPFPGGSIVEIATQHVLAPLPQLPAALAVLQPVLDRLLAKEPEQRYESAQAYIDALRQVFLSEDTLRQQVGFSGSSRAWSSQLAALGFALDPQQQEQVRVAQGRALEARADTSPMPAQPLLDSGATLAAAPATSAPARPAPARDAAPAAPVPAPPPPAAAAARSRWPLVAGLLVAVLLAGGAAFKFWPRPAATTAASAPAASPAPAVTDTATPPAATPAQDPAVADDASDALEPGSVFTDPLQDGSEGPHLVVIPAGSFMMGSPDDEEGREADEGPQRTVAVDAFAMGRIEVTVAQFRQFATASGYQSDAERNTSDPGCYVVATEDWTAGLSWQSLGFEQDDEHPAVCLSWNDAQAYVEWLSAQTGQAYRLPSEAEQEYVIRAGSTTSYPWGEDGNTACMHGNVADQATQESYPDWTRAECMDGYVHTSVAGGYEANAFGLADTVGNAWEWSADCWNETHAGAPADATARSDGDCEHHTLRGGGWDTDTVQIRSAFRSAYPAEARGDASGLRVARDL